MKTRDLDKSSFLSYSFLSDSQKAQQEYRNEEYNVIAQRPGSRKAFIEQSGGKKLRKYENPESRGLLGCFSCKTDDNIDRSVAPQFQGTKDRTSRINTINQNPKKSENENFQKYSPSQNNRDHTPTRLANSQPKELNEIAYSSSLNTQEGRDTYREMMLKRLRIMNLTEERYEDMIIRDFYNLAADPDQSDLQKLMVVVNKPDFKTNFEISESEYNKFDKLFGITELKREKIYTKGSVRGSRISIQKQNQNFQKIEKEDSELRQKAQRAHTFGETITGVNAQHITPSQKFNHRMISPLRTTQGSNNTQKQYSSRAQRSPLHKNLNFDKTKRSTTPLRTPFRETYTTPQRVQQSQYRTGGSPRYPSHI